MPKPSDVRISGMRINSATMEVEEIIPLRWNEVDQVWFTHGANGKLLQHPDRETVLAMYHLTKDN